MSWRSRFEENHAAEIAAMRGLSVDDEIVDAWIVIEDILNSIRIAEEFEKGIGAELTISQVVEDYVVCTYGDD